MVERTDEIEKSDDEEAQAAIEEAQSVLDDVETSTGTGNSGGALGSSSSSSSGESGSVLPSLSLPSLSMPSPSVPDPSELFSSGYFLFALIAVTAAMFVGGMVVPFVDKLGGLVALFAVTFLMGATADERHYLEVGLASAAVVGVLSFLERLTLAIISGAGLPLALMGVVIGLVVGLGGTYMGRDLRAGLGKDVDGSSDDGPLGGDDPPEW